MTLYDMRMAGGVAFVARSPEEFVDEFEFATMDLCPNDLCEEGMMEESFPPFDVVNCPECDGKGRVPR